QRLAGLTSQHQESRRQTAMRHRNAGKFWRSDSGRHARDDLEPNTCVRKDERFFSTPAKDERVATLEPDHAFALPSRANHQPVDRLLLHAGAPGALADTETLRPCELPQRLSIDQRVVENEISLLDALQRTNGPQLRVTGTCTNQRDSTFTQLPTPNAQLPTTPNAQRPTTSTSFRRGD